MSGDWILSVCMWNIGIMEITNILYHPILHYSNTPLLHRSINLWIYCPVESWL